LSSVVDKDTDTAPESDAT